MNWKNLTFLCGILLLAAPTQAGKPQDWAKAFSGDKVQKMEFNNYDFLFFKTCTVPGEKKTEAASKSRFADFEDEAPATDADSLKEQLDSFKETRDYYQEMVKGAETKIKALGEDANSAEKEFLEEDLKVAKTMLEEVEKSIKEVEDQLNPKDEKKEEPAKEGKGKGNAEKKAAPKPKPTHEEQTEAYYNISYLPSKADDAFMSINSILGTELNWSKPRTKVYFVTSPKMWQTLKTPERVFQPARNVCWDSKQRAILLFGSPAITNKLAESFAYAVASMALDLGLTKINPEGELCNFIHDGLAGYASELDVVVDPNKIYSFGNLKNRELLLVTELLNPTRMKDNKRCYYFLKQSSAFAKYMVGEQQNNLRKYLQQAKGGNSGFRNSFQFLEVSKYWGLDYDSFCQELPQRIFFPLTEDSENDPNAMDKWESELSAQDQEQDEKKRLMEERKKTRDIRRKVGDEAYRKYYKK